MKNLKKIISVMLAVLIVFFCSAASMVTASAEEVTPSNTYDTAYFKNLFEKAEMDTTQFTLSDLTPDNYTVILSQSLYDEVINIHFIPKSKDNDFYIYNTYSENDIYLNDYSSLPLDNYPCIVGANRGINVTAHSSFTIFNYNTQQYLLSYNKQHSQYSNYGFIDSGTVQMKDFIEGGSEDYIPNTTIFQALSDGARLENLYVSDANLYNLMSSTGLFTYTEILGPTNKSLLRYAPNLLASLNSIFGGYTGEILDTSVAGMINEYGIEAPSTIYDDYKNKLYYMQNNDLSMVFMNNAETPSYKKEDYNGIYEGAKKYTFTYAKTYDAIVFFPQYQKYLKFDDWWNANSKGGIDWGAWGNFGIIDVITSTNDKSKTFYLMSDWDVTFNDTGGSSYSGTRVIMSWNNEYGEALDSNTMMKPWEDNSETLKNQGWQEGRPNDMNYPFCIDYYMNGMPTTRIYLNSKPKIEVERTSDNKCSYKICMLGTYGYFYDVLSDMHCSFDFTVNYDIENPYGLTFVDIYNDYLEAIHINYVSLGDEFQLELWENWKGNENYYTGTKVFFNWDIRSNWYNSLRDDTFDYNEVILDSVGGYVDNNGNQHGGNLSDYADSDLNKNNDNGNKQENNSSPSSDGFQFTADGIFAYCSEHFKFMKYIFDLFPAWIWLSIGTFIAVLIALRVLGR